MPRLPRLNIPNVLYYVTSRSGDRQPLLFRDRDDYFAYLQLLLEYRKTHGIRLFAYCLLPDAVHLCLELEDGGTISGFMHDVTTRYTKAYNRRYERAGHLFMERFRTVLIEKAPQLLPVTAYVHSLPGRFGIQSEFTQYPYSSCSQYLSQPQELAGEVGEVLGLLPSSGNAYEEFLSSLEPAAMDAVERGLSQRLFGSEAFVASMRNRLAAVSKPAVAPQPAQPVRAIVRARKPVWSPVRLGWISAASILALILGVGVQKRMGAMETTIQSLAKENETLFSTRDIFTHYEQSAQRSLQLPGSEWEVRVVPTDAEAGATARVDQITFGHHQMTAAGTLAMGFGSSNYTLTPQTDGSVVWETMQNNGKGEVVCWRGEWRGDAMRGILTRQMAGQAPENFNFIGIQRGTNGATQHET